MRQWIYALMLATLACNLSACGTKGKLKSPSQIEAEEQKKARKEEKEKATQEEKAKEASPSLPSPEAGQ